MRPLGMLCEVVTNTQTIWSTQKTSILWKSKYQSSLQSRSNIWLTMWCTINAVGLDFYYLFILTHFSLWPARSLLALKTQEILNLMHLVRWVHSINPLNKHVLTEMVGTHCWMWHCRCLEGTQGLVGKAIRIYDWFLTRLLNTTDQLPIWR